MIGIYEYMKRLGFGRMKRSPRYLQQIRLRPCLLCGSTQAVEAHHEGPHGLGKKTPDWLAVPLCRSCHHDRHHAKVPDTYQTRVYSAQVQYLCWEIERARPAMPTWDSELLGFDVVCGLCGRPSEVGRPSQMVPVCRACAKEQGLTSQYFATEYGLASYREEGQIVQHIRQLHVLILAAVAAKAGEK